eukprot:9814652-Karenia_brevis.AAC.1
MEYGIFVGVNRKSNEFLIADQEGIGRVRPIRRIPEEQTWGVDNLKWIKWAPWNKYEGDAEEDGEVPEG